MPIQESETTSETALSVEDLSELAALFDLLARFDFEDQKNLVPRVLHPN